MGSHRQWAVLVTTMAILPATCASSGCPPPPPPPAPGSFCAVALNNVKSVESTPNSGPLVVSAGQERTLTVKVSAPGTQRTDVVYCVGLLAGNLPTNRATDHPLGGTILIGDGAGNFTGSFKVRCNSAGHVEVFAADTQGTFGWNTTNTRENNVYALTLPAGLFSPASNTVDIKCQ
jgi:hypothetical protein